MHSCYVIVMKVKYLLKPSLQTHSWWIPYVAAFCDSCWAAGSLLLSLSRVARATEEREKEAHHQPTLHHPSTIIHHHPHFHHSYLLLEWWWWKWTMEWEWVIMVCFSWWWRAGVWVVDCWGHVVSLWTPQQLSTLHDRYPLSVLKGKRHKASFLCPWV